MLILQLNCLPMGPEEKFKKMKISFLHRFQLSFKLKKSIKRVNKKSIKNKRYVEGSNVIRDRTNS